MKIIIELTADFGHPNNEPSKQAILKSVASRLPELLKKDTRDDHGVTALARWDVSGVKVE
jgi:hypothetical protein